MLKYGKAAMCFVFFGFIVVMGIKGCIISVWVPPKSPEAYAVVGTDKREMTFTIYPDRHALVTYGDPSQNSFEAVLLKLSSGEIGSHYIGPLWNVSRGGESPFGIRWLADGETPVCFETKLLNKLHVGIGDSAFTAVGSETRTTMYFRPNGLYYAGAWLEATKYDAASFDPIVAELRSSAKKSK